MYDLPYYREHDEPVIMEFIERYPFAFLTGCDSTNRPVATQAPVFLEQRENRIALSGHIMKGTDHHEAFSSNEQVLAVFNGPHTYVSATWYSNPQVASTWNYMSVHARGVIRFLDRDGLEAVLRKTSLHFENHDEQSSTVFDNLPAEFTNKVMNMIVGFEIEVSELKAVFKLSQERDAQTHRRIVEKLNNGDEDARKIATEMKKRSP
jgi:transcriptional regulator